MNQQDRRSCAAAVGGECECSDMSSDQQTPTPEQIAAGKLRYVAEAFGAMEQGSFKGWKVREILEQAARTLASSQFALPTKPGRYEDDGQDSGWMLHGDGSWHYNDGPAVLAFAVAEHGPFTRLVPERPQVTREQMRAALGSVLANVMNYPDEVSSRLLGQDFSGLIGKATDASLALVNGDPR